MHFIYNINIKIFQNIEPFLDQISLSCISFIPPLPPRQALDLPERADEPQAGTQTDTQTDTQTLARTHAKGDSWPAQAPQPEPERLGALTTSTL